MADDKHHRAAAGPGGQQGLTKKPTRRKRTQEQMLGNLNPARLPKVARPVDHKTIEYIPQKNPFYLGKIKTQNGYQNVKSHQPLTHTALIKRGAADTQTERLKPCNT